jgi:hypothetical protein
VGNGVLSLQQNTTHSHLNFRATWRFSSVSRVMADCDRCHNKKVGSEPRGRKSILTRALATATEHGGFGSLQNRDYSVALVAAAKLLKELRLSGTCDFTHKYG